MSPLRLVFEDSEILMQCTADRQPWFHAETLCRLLGYQDQQAALLAHCRPAGLLFGNDQTPQAMVDLESLLCLSIHGAGPRAGRFRTWLCRVLLPQLFSSIGLPSYRQLNVMDERLLALKWHEGWWLSVSDVMRLFGAHPELLAPGGENGHR